jgi:hypothetical protein
MIGLLAGACGSDDDSSGSGETDDPVNLPEDDEAENPPDEEETEQPAEESASEPAGGGSTASVTLANGEKFEFGILCALESQEAAGQEILFTVVSYDDPANLDITQFGASSDFEGAVVGIYDSTTYDTLWEANDALFDGAVDLQLDGSTITGTATFFADGDPFGEPVEGEVVANC